jgi:hypothetical protein
LRRLKRGAALLGTAAAIVALTPAATAANSATYRDCSFTGGIDPDYVELLSGTPGPNGTVSVPASQTSIQVKASESSDPGDSSGHDTFKVTVSTPGQAARTLSGAGVGMVTLTVPLANPAPGATYTIGWAATFDNGGHSCPGSQTPQNSMPTPFVVTVAGSGTPTAPTSPSGHPRARHHKRHRCNRRRGKRVCHRGPRR